MGSSFAKAYKLFNYDLDCPSGCTICEDGPLIFLPGEIDFVSVMCDISKEILAKPTDINGKEVWVCNDNPCPFYKCGRCVNRDFRPFDCRSYPVIPYLKDGKLDVKLDKTCPLVQQKKMGQGFLGDAKKGWEYLAPPIWWLKIYQEFS